jgi:hypothetical protein
VSRSRLRAFRPEIAGKHGAPVHPHHMVTCSGCPFLPPYYSLRLLPYVVPRYPPGSAECSGRRT